MTGIILTNGIELILQQLMGNVVKHIAEETENIFITTRECG